MTKRITAFMIALILFCAICLDIPATIVKAESNKTDFQSVYNGVPQDVVMPAITHSSIHTTAPNINPEDELPSTQLLRNNMIRIANASQLLAIGSNQVITNSDLNEETFGQGIPVAVNDVELTYNTDALYLIEQDIPLTQEIITFLYSFTGTIYGWPKAETTQLYDTETDTIYIFTLCQIALLLEEEIPSPIMTGDESYDTFGIGQFIFDSNEQMITYDNTHSYMLSASFTTQHALPESLNRTNIKASNSNDAYIQGRDYFGQTSVTIDGTTYILIGDRQQLDAINNATNTATTKVSGPVYEVYQRRASLGNWNAYNIIEQTETLIYPGDADLIEDVWDGTTLQDFSYPNRTTYPMYDNNNGILSTDTYHSLTTVLDITGYSRIVYCTVNANGDPDINERSFPNLNYTKNGHYIVFRDINMYSDQWTPLMFTGVMIGAKADSSLWNTAKTELNINPSNKPIIYNINVNPATLNDPTVLDLGTQTGVGFFGTLTGAISESDLIGSQCLVQNIKLYNGTVTNNTTRAGVSQTLVNGLLTFLARLLGTVLDPVLSGLLGKTIRLQDTLEGLLNTRAADPASLATGAFTGRIIGNASVIDCEVEDITVTAAKTTYEDKNNNNTIDEHDGKIVGFGGFVGYSEGVTNYDLVSLGLGGVVDALSSLLNIIPGLGLGDLINVLLENTLPVRNLIPTGYTCPQISDCVVNNCDLSANNGKYGVGGFAGSLCGTIVTNCKVENCNITINAHHFGGGFAGVTRDAVIKGTLSGLGIDVLAQLHPQSELINCEINNCDLSIVGNYYLGGFTGVLANSDGINDTIDENSTLEITGTKDWIGGFCGYARLGTLFGLGDYLEESESLLSTVKDIATGLLGTGGDQSLLDLGGVAPAAILGFEQNGILTVSSSQGGYVGGIVGRGDGCMISSSSPTNLRSLAKYKRQRNGEYINTLPITSQQARDTVVYNLQSVDAHTSYAGGIAGYLTTANVGGLLGDTLGVAQFLGFTVSNTAVYGTSTTNGFTVNAGETCAAGGIGWAVGGDIIDTDIIHLTSVTANNNAGGFVGMTGPGDLANGGGLDVTLLNISLIKVNNLLSLFSGIRTTYLRANVTGVTAGYTVEETGYRTNTLADYNAGGYVASANSVRIVDCHAINLLSVTANISDGNAGGFVALSSAGNVAGLADESHTSGVDLLALNQLIDAIPTLVPSYDGCTVSYVNNGHVTGDTAGGFAGDFRSGVVNQHTMTETEISGNTYVGVNPIDTPNTTYEYTNGNSAMPWSVINIRYVKGGHYAGGWGGHVYPGALAKTGGGLSLLGAANTSAISASDLLNVADVYIPMVSYAGVYADQTDGLTVYAAFDTSNGSSPATAGYAGGYIGYGQGMQISFCDVTALHHGEINEPSQLTAREISVYNTIGILPAALESVDGSAYMNFNNSPLNMPYAIAGARYAGGYIGHMDVGAAASIGDQLNILGNNIALSDILGLLNAVVATIEHSDVHGNIGGFSVIASSRINQHNGEYDDNGVGYAGGFAGKISGGHIQDSNVDNFAYIIGEVAAGGYVGKMVAGDVAKVVDNANAFNILDASQLGSLATLISDFVPTIRNSETTCIPCGGAVRAQSSSDANNQRGMAGGYVGHSIGGQIWGLSDAHWKTENTYTPPTGRSNRKCAAIRIRSVYGAEYAGGFCGLVESGSQASVGELSILSSLLQATNTLSTLEATYPTIKSSYVNGPLRDISEATWNMWKQYIGAYGAMAPELKTAEYNQLSEFIYGTHVVAGRQIYNLSTLTKISGCAGGFVGAMHSGVIRNSYTLDTKLVLANRAAGGFAGEMQTGNLASLGGISALGLVAHLGNIVNSLGSFMVPAVYDSGTTGYRMGITVGAYGDSTNPDIGMSGGFTGGAYGAQIHHAWVHNLKLVKGTNAIGGFVGKGSAASLLTADTTEASDENGLLQKVMNWLLENANNFSHFANVLEATICTIQDTDITGVESWGYVVDGEYNSNNTIHYARYAGGYAGILEATVINKRNDDTVTTTITGLRGVNGDHYAGGFVGCASVGGVAQVGGSHTNVLNLLNLGNVGLLDIFRTYIYNAEINGVDDGICIYAHNWEILGGELQNKTVSGTAGGFIGDGLSCTAFNCVVNNLNTVSSPIFAGGFMGHGGKKGVLDLSGLSVDNSSVLGTILTTLGLDLSTSIQLLDCIGSTIKHCEVHGYDNGYVVQTYETLTATNLGVEDRFVYGACAGGFAGYADLTHIESLDSHDCIADNLKLVVSPQVAGGFVGRTSVAYLADLHASSDLVGAILDLLDIILRAIQMDDLENLGLISLNSNFFGLDLLAEGYVVKLNLFGLVIGVSAVTTDPDSGESSAMVTIGSSTISLPIGTDGKIDRTNLNINLIQVNRTDVKNATAQGVPLGYDVFGGGASQDADGTQAKGYAGGFVGYNDNGYFSHDTVILCDTVRGTANKVGPFSGYTKTKENAYPTSYFESNNNVYNIYRSPTQSFTHLETASGTSFADCTTDNPYPFGITYNRYEIAHMDIIQNIGDLQNANEVGTSTQPLNAYISNTQVNLMLNREQLPNPKGETLHPDESKDPCEDYIDITMQKIWHDDENADNIRPTEITIQIITVDAGTNVPNQFVVAGYPAETPMRIMNITLRCENDESEWMDGWMRIIQNLPISYHTDSSTPELHYLQYYVYEPNDIANYTATYNVIQNTASVRLINSHHSLPNTGGSGISIYYICGAILVVSDIFIITILLTKKRRYKNNRPI